jgi:MoaA/NifB/PqqE/SkfB family radical SAM enzyme
MSLTKHFNTAIRKYRDLAGMFLAKEPTYFIFYVTSSCNAQCRICFNWEYNNPSGREQELSLEEIERIAGNMGRLHYVTLGGGEPFLRNDIDEICRIFYDKNHTRIFSIPTNCLTPQIIAERVEAMLQKCPDAVFRISMSIDGIGAQHDRLRGVAGSFDQVCNTYLLLDRLRQRYPQLEILANTTFCADNQDSISDIHDYVVSRFSLDMYGLTLIRGEVRDPALKKIDLGKFAAATRLFEEGYFRNQGAKRHPLQRILAILPVFSRREILKTATAARRTYTCHAIRQLIVVDSFGDVFACEMLPFKLGNLREVNYRLGTILKKPETIELLQRIRRKECNCTWECAIQNSMVFNLKKYPAMFYEAFFK